MVIRYSFLWQRESMKGQEEGRKDRPCVIVVATKNDRVAVVPITTKQPDLKTPALELPAQIGKQLGIGDRRSWIIADETNIFQWPGEDIRPATRDSWAFGQLPPNYTKDVVQGFQQQRQRMKAVSRDDPPPKKNWGKKVEKPSKPKPPPPPNKDRGRSR